MPDSIIFNEIPKSRYGLTSFKGESKLITLLVLCSINGKSLVRDTETRKTIYV